MKTALFMQFRNEAENESNGKKNFLNQSIARRAAEIAMQTVTEFMAQKQSEMKVIFNVFKDLDYEIYKKLLRTN